MGYDSAMGYPWAMFCRFPNINIPNGATIDSAKITFKAGASDSGSITMTIYAEDVDNASAPTNYATHQTARGNGTTATVSWTPSNWAINLNYDTVDISTVIKEIIDRGGWSSGNAILILIDRNSDNGERVARSYDNGSGYPALYIDWS